MDFRIIALPPFTAVTSGPDPEFDFSPEGVLGRFNAYFSAISPDNCPPRDFLFFNKEAGGLEWWYAINDSMPDGGYNRVGFDGGMYLTYTYRDHDEEANNKLYQEALEYIEKGKVLELDERPGHYSMGHIITPPKLIKARGYAVMECYVPVKLREN
ncbi:hypothetical protein I5Q82_18470 [Acutalibacter muris]|uniref:AraC family transcriptional regulator n=2 Tax=Acutalibacter muris TaxID=1796620 RepID=A0A1Z2XQF1_9FIRM|nr:hypothetical protein [Acutalibacter muris]ANU52648.1 hypothetical protein A4V00_00670 [Hungateiclostridiaceae bacterium KB18]ASB40685.1 hypothetical protein ADH66_08430 [Acutalibacter muris]QQR29962.1 hypothetical protein I5Q82_18470 [Acutalibacter muris]